MKKIRLLFALTVLLSFVCLFSEAQFPLSTTTYSAASYTTDGSQGAVSFVIGNKAYSGTGSFLQEFWEYDPSTNIWTRKADFPGAGRLRAVAFSIGGKGYIGTGQSTSNSTANDFWEYDPSNDTWTQKASIPVGRRQAVGFSIGSKGYVGTGATTSSSISTDFYEYDPATNTWTAKANLPGAARRSAAGFSIGSKGYIGTGLTTSNAVLSDFWEYDPSANTWTQKADFTGPARALATGISSSSIGYIGGGTNLSSWYGDVFKYDPSTNSWASNGTIGSRSDATGFAIHDQLYFGLGIYGSSSIVTTFRRISPYYEVRNSTGDYDEYPVGNCFNYPLNYTGNWSGYVECPPAASDCYAGFSVNTLQNLGNICYKSRVDASALPRGGYGWYGGATQEEVRFCRRNLRIEFANQPSSPVSFRIFYTKAELDALISSFNLTFGTSKNYNDLVIIKYNGISQDLDPSNNSNTNSDYEQIIPTITYYGYSNQYLYAEFNVSSYSEYYLGLKTKRFYRDADGDGFGNPSILIFADIAPSGYVTDNTDCNDNNASSYPGATEIQNSIDDNCDGQVDEGLITTNQFIFLKGNATEFSIGSYGTQGVASVGNNPGKRRFPTMWDYNDKIYLFGGEGNATNTGNPPPNGNMNDLWEFDPATNNWRWLKGSSSLGGGVVTGTQGIAAAANTPGAKTNAMGWKLNGKLYLFGGSGRFNDLWEYDPAINQWRWLNGSPNMSNISPTFGTQGIFDGANNPGSRDVSTTWVNNGRLFLFGGITRVAGVDVKMSDLWEYDPSINQWRWIKGPNSGDQFGVYGTQGVSDPANNPGARLTSGGALIGNKFYLFGGEGLASLNTGGWNNDLWEYDHTTNNWTWLKGSSVSNQAGIYGTMGSYDPSNTPGIRKYPGVSAVSGKLYVMGGFGWGNTPGDGFLNDLWEYDPVINQWRWIKGDNVRNISGIHGFQNIPDNANKPGGRYSSYYSLQSLNGELYYFGGEGYNATVVLGYLNDLWRFNFSNNQWTWLKGASGKQYYGEYGTKGIVTSTNKPGAKNAASSIGANGKYYLFGGSGSNTYPNGGTSNDMWEYDPTTNNWKWLKGSNTSGAAGNYGTQGVAASTNDPSFRTNAMLWSIGNKIYMFGGTVGANLNDLWEYDLTTNNWTWLKGSNTYNQSGIYGTKGVAASTNTPGARWQAAAFTYNNKLYLFGGNGLNSGATSGELNDLWEYDPGTNNWTWLSGNDAINSFGIYGTINVAAPANIPGGRETAQMHTIGSKAYLFGGRGYASAGGFQNLNDTWEYDFATNQWTWKKGLSTGGNAGVAGSYGIEDPANYPIARYHATSWALSGKMYVFSGTPFGSEYNDLWEYNPATNNWRYIKGRGNLGNTPANYGLQGIANHNNLPSIRWQSTAAASGNSAYIFGGLGGFANSLSPNSGTSMNDLWKWVAGPVFTYGTERKLYVNDNNQTGDIYTTAIGNNQNTGTPSAPLATLDFAVSVAQPGDTIFVDAGTFVTPNFGIGKALTILGTNYTISPNDATDPLLYNTGRNAESVISGSTITIGASNINIEGVSFEPGSKTQIQQTNTTLDYSNIKIKNNRFSVSSNLNLINLTGRNITPLSSNNYFILNNRFEKKGGGSGTSFALNFINNIEIKNNAFISGVFWIIQSGFTLGNTGKTDNVLIEQNYFDKPNAPFTISRVGYASITNNTTTDSRLGFRILNSVTEPSTIVITNNAFGNVRINGVIDYQRSGGSDISGNNTLIIDNNIINMNAGVQPETALSMILANVQNTVQNAQVSITNNKMNYGGDFSSHTSSYVFGIRLAGQHKNITIERNEINFTGVNLNIPEPDALSRLTGLYIFSKASITGNFNAIPADGIININNNKIHGFKQSAAFIDVTTLNYGGLLSGITSSITNNSFTGDSISINNGTTSETINANCNWYGATASQDVLNKITPATVNHIPWLTDGTDTDIPTVGFQPAAGACNGTPVVITLDNATDISCFGADNGSINVSISGGTAPYTYAWTKDEDPLFSSTDEDLTNLEPGTYYLVVTDANGSTSTQLEVIINEPELLTATADGTNNICFGGEIGTASVLAGGGKAPYSYLWSNAATTDNISGLTAGIYNVTVTDANGCTATASYEVTQPPLIVLTLTNTSTACSNNATVSAVGGTGAYSYLWSNGSTSSTISSVPAGTYTVTVTDANGCFVSGNISLTVNEAFNPSASVSDVSCYSGANGVITITNANATAPFEFSIDGINFLPGVLPYSFNNLNAGTYTIAVRDVNGCVGFVTKTITQPTELNIVLNTVQSTCYSLNAGSINVSVSGGTPAYSYQWSGPSGYSSTQLNISGLATGNYSLTVTDNKGCVKTLNVVVPSFSQINVNSTVTNIACKGELNGSIALAVTGGTGSGFSYLWNTGATSGSISNLGVGNYNVTITDIGSGCVVTRSYTITQPASVVAISANKTNATGCNSLGTITITGSGGTPGYTYSIDGINYQAANVFTGLYAGSYTVYVKDANGCTKSTTVTITDNGSDEFESNNSKNQSKTINVGTTISARIALAADVADWFKFTTGTAGDYVLTLTHPSASFTFNMYPAGNNVPALVPTNTTATTKEYTLAANTVYYISVTGGLSYICYQLDVSEVAVPFTKSPIWTQINEIKEVHETDVLRARVFPNPHQGNFTLQVESPEDGMAIIQLIGADGRMIITKNVMLFKGKVNKVSFTNIRQAELFYRIRLENFSASGKVIGPN